MELSEVKNKRIAKNAVLLYVRTLLVMIVSLYTSRVVLQTLGVDNYGVYNVIGGMVAMFSVVTGPISAAISRFLTYGLGKGNIYELRIIFSTSINIQILLSLIVVILGETIGLWFLNNKLNIPAGSMYNAHWVLQCTIISIVIGMINMPYSALIVSHEKMGVFAYMSILDVFFKLGLAFFITAFPTNTLIYYSVGIVLIGLIQRLIYLIYCSGKFEECRYKLIIDRDIFKQMTGFAWWTFLGGTAYIFNTQGVSMIMNVYFGVAVNTAKGIAMQVESSVMSFVSSFTTAFTPQITKSYAEGDKDFMVSIMCRGSKFSVFLILLFLIPLEFEAPMVLRLWLGEEPVDSALFLRLSLICTATMLLGNPFYQGIIATGNIRNYQIVVTVVGCSVFPLTWLAYKIGLAVDTFYWIYFVVYNILIWIRMWFCKRILGFRIKNFVKGVFIPVILCTLLSIPVPGIIFFMMDDTIVRLLVLTLSSFITSTIIILSVGMTSMERKYILSKIHLAK